jgi:predicted small metal-binding protein
LTKYKPLFCGNTEALRMAISPMRPGRKPERNGRRNIQNDRTMTIEQVIARIERARSIYENAIDSDIVKGRVAMCNDIVNTLRLETEFHPKQEQQELPEGLEEAAFTYENDLWESGFKDSGYSPQEVNAAFIAGAEYQRKQDQSLIELAEDHAMLAGMNKMKEEMMEKIKSRISEILGDAQPNPVLRIELQGIIDKIKNCI